ncbi:hypothetical protein [Armatimonas sp.]|uniref:hypothetical protein n=1 Tax=Armatimonas sp. TaxID=1872638 RepID=UPI00286CFE7C|nr:hypothetical protein [Armatimonas sp.]
MRVIQEENHQGHRIVVGEKPGIGYIGRSPIRQWSYRVLLNDEDISECVVVSGMKPDQLIQSARHLLAHRLSSSEASL